MTTITVKPEVGAALAREAQQRGLNLSDLLEHAVELLALESKLEEEEDAELDVIDAERMRHILATSDPSQRRTLADLRAAIDARRAQDGHQPQQEAA